MAYDHGKQQIELSATNGVPALAATATTAVKQFRWVPMNNVVIRGWGVIGLATKAGAPRFSLRVNATAGAASASGDQVSTMTLATAVQRGKWTIRKGLTTTVTAGSSVHVQVTTAVTGYTVGAALYVENKPYDFVNQTGTVTLVTT